MQISNNQFDLTSIGGRFAKIRTDHNFTQQKIGEKMGLSRETISQMERDERRITDKEIAFIAKNFVDVDIYWFLLGDDLSEVKGRANDKITLLPSETKVFRDFLYTFARYSK